MKLNKVIEKCEERFKEAERTYGDCYATGVLEELLLDLKDTEEYRKACDMILNDSQKVTVPQFVADWIEVCKEHLTSSLYLAMTPSFLKANNQGIELTIWIKKNEEAFARAWFDGYTVEKEKLYLVKMKGIEKDYNFLNLIRDKKVWVLSSLKEDLLFRTKHTRKELEEAGFGWVFSCEGMEVKEVK